MSYTQHRLSTEFTGHVSDVSDVRRLHSVVCMLKDDCPNIPNISIYVVLFSYLLVPYGYL